MKKNSQTKIGILGYGEIGKAISNFYKNPKIKDLNRDDGFAGIDILHVCIPWSENFEKIVKDNVKQFKPKLVIIHSTVAPGTTKKIGRMAVHSPVRGVHPFLFKGVKTFVKYIGADDRKTGAYAQKHLQSLGIKTKLVFPSKNTEALKLWDTTQYGWMILLNKEIKNWCQKNKVDFDFIYKEGNISYNEGYKKLGRPEVARPYLQYMPGKIGGHCVIPNCKILDSKIAKLILENNDSY